MGAFVWFVSLSLAPPLHLMGGEACGARLFCLAPPLHLMERGLGGEVGLAAPFFCPAPPLRLRRGGWGVRSECRKKLMVRGTPNHRRTTFQSQAKHRANIGINLNSEDRTQSGTIGPN